VLFVCLDDRSSQTVATQDSAENVNKNSLDFFVSVQQLQSFYQLLAISRPTDIKEVGRLTTVAIYYVHR
jgi:hypothetical protein